MEAQASVSGLAEERASTASRPRYGRGGDGRRAASRAVRRPRRERRLGPRRGGGNLPAREVLAVFSKPATYPGVNRLANHKLTR